MRDLIIVTVLCLFVAILIDHFWLNGHYLSEIRYNTGISIGAAKRQ